MAIHFITGKPGAGKGLYSARWLVDELRQGNRPIITNLAVELGPWVNGVGKPMVGLLAYLKNTYGSTFNAENRVFRVTDEQIEQFFVWRACKGDDGKYSLQCAHYARDIQKDGTEKITSFDTTLHLASGPQLIIVDECWKFWGSRNWQKTGEGLVFYAKQHRKFGDDVLLCTQHTKDIDTIVVRVAQDFYVCRNRSMLRMGVFRQPDDFKVSVYENPPTGTSQEPMNTITFKLDVAGLAQTYDTTAGVGVVGGMAGDVQRRKKGLPWKYVYVAGALLILCVWLIIRWSLHTLMASGTKALMGSSGTVASAVASTSTNATVAQALGFVPRLSSKGSRDDSSLYPDLRKAEPIYMTGTIWAGRVWGIKHPQLKAFLSDGRIVVLGENGCTMITAEYCEVDGVRYQAAPVTWGRGQYFQVQGPDMPSSVTIHNRRERIVVD